MSLLAAILLLGLGLRVYRFPHLPAGLNQDEISSAYESFSLLRTGADRWGLRWPLYFLGWGSGQNVLQSYLEMPAIALWGLTPFGARIVPLLCGLCTLPVFYATVRRTAGDVVTALLATLFLAVSPWHVMLSRWGLESNLLPFFLLLGVFTFLRAADREARWPIFALLPFALAFYAYGIAVLLVPLLALLLLGSRWRAVRLHKRGWTLAVLIAGLVASPILLFTWKNYVSKRDFGFEAHLPVTIPLLPTTRLSQINHGSVLGGNGLFLRHGLQDFNPWNQVPGLRPLPWFVLLLAMVGAVAAMRRFAQQRGPANPFLLWLLASLPLLLIARVNINQANTLFLPILALAGEGAGRLLTLRPGRAYQAAATTAVVCLALASAAIFARGYLSPAYTAAMEETFNPTLPEAMRAAGWMPALGIRIYVTDSLPLNYVQTLFYEKVDPITFQVSRATVAHPDFGPYLFSRAEAAAEAAQRPIGYLLRDTDPPLCGVPFQSRHVGAFYVGICR